MVVPTQLEEGCLLNDRYRILKPLGHGGMGTVYLARHERLGTEVAVKEIRGQHTNDEEYKATLEQCSKETRFMVSLNHPNLPKVSDAFVENERFYLVMEYIEGVTLEAKLWENGSKPLDVKHVVEWGLQVADVLAYLHSQEPAIIFRDLKPANIMLQPDNNVRLIDFGIARRFQPGASKDTMLLGSVGYSPPEQFGRHQTDTRSDIYAFGATLHQLITGRDPSQQPFKFPPARSLNLAVPEVLSRLLERCLAIEVEGRPRNIREVAYELVLARDELLRSPGGVQAHSGSHEARLHGGSRSGSAHGSVSGKRIPSGSQESYRMPSGSVSSSGGMTRDDADPGRRNMVVAIGGLLLLLIIGIPLGLALSHHRDVPQPIVTHVTVPSTDTGPSGPKTVPTNTSSQSTDPPGTETEPPIIETLSSTLVPEPPSVVQDPSRTGYWLTLPVSGTVKGKPKGGWMIAAFLFDGQGNPVLARDPSNKDYSAEGQLTAGVSIAPGSDGQFSTDMLRIPSYEFPAMAPSSGLKYVIRIFADRQKVVQETTMQEISVTWPNDFFSVDSNPAPSAPSTGVGISGGNR